MHCFPLQPHLGVDHYVTSRVLAILTLFVLAWPLCVQAVEQHTQALSSWLTGQLTSLRHSTGAPLIQLYGRHSEQQQGTGFSQGAIFNFQVLQQDGQPVSFSRIDQEATAAGLFLRSGCVCNPGVSRLAVRPSAFVMFAVRSDATR